MRISKNYKNSGTHIPTLLKVVPLTNGDVCEMGVGFNSTPILHWLCQGRELVSYESDPDYYRFARQFQTWTHKVKRTDWSDVDFDRHWSVVFIDHSNRPRTRGDDAVKFTNADLIILHDTEPEEVEHYGYQQVFDKYKYRYDFTDCKPFTSVVSNVIDVTKWKPSSYAPETHEKELSIVIPARNEIFLAKTIENILENIEADTEIIAILDGAWADPVIVDHPRVNIIHLTESIGQRAATNLGVKIARGKYIMKVDAHCAFDKGFDRKMLDGFKVHGDNVVSVPIMRNLHAFDWVCPSGHRRYQSPPGVCTECGESTEMEIVWVGKSNPQSVAYCFDSEPHFQYDKRWSRTEQYKEQLPTGFTETMSLQGSCFVCTKQMYNELNLCDESVGSWGNQGIEVACKAWLSGGRVLCNHSTWYAHFFRVGGIGFPYSNPESQIQTAKKKVWGYFFNGEFKQQVHPVSWLLKKFAPVPGWTDEQINNLK